MTSYHFVVKNIALTFLFLSFWGCKTSPKESLEEGTFVALQFESLRAHGDDAEENGTTTPNTDIEHKEDAIKELRVILYPTGVDTPVFNQKFAEQELSSQRVVFKLKDFKHYDFYFIANESASNQSDTDLAFLKSNTLNRRQLEEFSNVKIESLVHSNKQFTGKEDYIMMTACYKNILLSKSLQGSGSASNPYIVDFTIPNKAQRPIIRSSSRQAVEMMRSLAKLELLFKGMVHIIPTGRKTYQYRWVLPYGFLDNTHLSIAVLNMPKSYTLFPKGFPTDIVQTGKVVNYTFDFSEAPEKENIVFPNNIREIPIGGVLRGDYKLTIYLPEYLTSSSLAYQERPGIQISYYTRDEPNMQTRFYPMQNSQTPTHYEQVLQALIDRPEWNVYRNRFYRITVEIQGRDFIGGIELT